MFRVLVFTFRVTRLNVKCACLCMYVLKTRKSAKLLRLLLRLIFLNLDVQHTQTSQGEWRSFVRGLCSEMQTDLTHLRSDIKRPRRIYLIAQKSTDTDCVRNQRLN